MGMLGAMAGAGKGISGHAEVLREKSKQDWVAQQEAVKYEREMNMKRLTEQGLNQRQSALFEFQGEQGDLSRAATKDLTQAQIESNELQSQANIESQESRLAAQLNLQKMIAEMKQTGENERQIKALENRLLEIEAGGEEQRKTVAAKEQAETDALYQQMENTLQLSQKERSRIASQVRDYYSKDGVISPTEELRLVGIETGLSLEEMVGAPGKPMAADVIKNLDAMLSVDEVYINATSEKKVSMMKDAYRRLNSAGSPTVTYDPVGDIERLKAMKGPEQKAAMDKIKASDPELYRQVSTDLAKASQNKPKGNKEVSGGMLSGIGSAIKKGAGAVKDFAQRDQSVERDIRRANKQKPTETKLAYDLRIEKLVKEATQGPKQIF